MNSDFVPQFLYEERAARLQAEAAHDRLTRAAWRRRRQELRSGRPVRRLALTRLARSARVPRHRRQPAL